MRFLLCTVFLLTTLSLNAQYEKGNWYLSGESAVSVGQHTNGLDTDSFEAFTGRSGYFLLDRLLVGANPVDPSAFVRYYQPLKREGKLAAFAELHVDADFGGARTRLTYQPAIGLEYQFSSDVLLSATLSRAFIEDLLRGTSLQFGINTIIGRGGVAPGQNLLSKGALFMDPNIGYVNFSSIDLSPGDIQLLSFGLRLGGGLMLSDRLSLEAGVSSSRFRSDYNDTPVTQALVVNTDLMADLGLRFFVTEKGRFRPYAGAGVSGIYEFQNVEFEEAGQSNFTERNFDVAPYLQLGSLFFLSDKVALDASLEYHLINADNSAVYDNQLGLGVGVKVFLGREE